MAGMSSTVLLYTVPIRTEQALRTSGACRVSLDHLGIPVRHDKTRRLVSTGKYVVSNTCSQLPAVRSVAKRNTRRNWRSQVPHNQVSGEVTVPLAGSDKPCEA